MSRQSDDISLDFEMLRDELLRQDSSLRMIFICKRLEKNLNKAFFYYFNLYVQLYHLATASVCVIDSYSIPVCVLKHKKKLNVIQIWHALGAIKKFSRQIAGKEFGHSIKVAESMQMHANYDVVIASGIPSVTHFSEAFQIEKDKIKIIGLPRIDYLLKNRSKIRSDVLKRYPGINDKKVVLYAPTFRNGNENGARELVRLIDSYKYNLIIKEHPNQPIYIEGENIIDCPEFSAMELLTIADYVITDYSALTFEASLLDKPVYFYLYDLFAYMDKNGLNIDLQTEFPGFVFTQVEKLAESIEKDSYDLKLIQDFRDKYIANKDGNVTEMLADLILRYQA